MSITDMMTCLSFVQWKAEQESEAMARHSRPGTSTSTTHYVVKPNPPK